MDKAKVIPDRIIREGFPKGWHVQHREPENVALLIKETPGFWPGSSCICLRPKAMDTDKWLPIAQRIAETFDHPTESVEALLGEECGWLCPSCEVWWAAPSGAKHQACPKCSKRATVMGEDDVAEFLGSLDNPAKDVEVLLNDLIEKATDDTGLIKIYRYLDTNNAWIYTATLSTLDDEYEGYGPTPAAAIQDALAKGENDV